jgi:hypothetical protein
MLVLIYLMTFLRKIFIFPIKWGKWVHGEVREFFLQKLIFAVLCTVFGVFGLDTESINSSNQQVHYIFKTALFLYFHLK